MMAASSVSAVSADHSAGRIILSCNEGNDLYRYLKATTAEMVRYNTPAEAIDRAPQGTGVLLLADGYPDSRTGIDAALYDVAAVKKLRLYVEYPSSLPDMRLGETRKIGWERTVVASDAFGPDLKRLRILMIHDCRFIQTEAMSPHLVVARVAGYDTAVFGVPDKSVWPILFEHPRGGILAATTKLSQFVTARYAPTDVWPAVWTKILKWTYPGTELPEIRVKPLVRPCYGRDERLPSDAERLAVTRGVDWYIKGRMLMHADYLPLMARAQENTTDDGTQPGPGPLMPLGDGLFGITEAYSSRIDWQGNQPVRWFVRADCCCESAMAFALKGKMEKDQGSMLIASNLLDFVLNKSPLQQGPRANPESPSYGLLGWDTRPQGAGVYYGDDNARALLGMIAASGAIGIDCWDAAIVRCALANFRTSCPQGFRNARIEEPDLQKNGWRWYWEKSDGKWGGWKRHSPHYQAYLWAVNLWLYDKTKFEPLLARTHGGISHMMGLFPDKWEYECGRKPSEYARMLLPLAWLVRVSDTPEHRAWLRKIAQKVIDSQDQCGAMGESVIAGEQSNEEYGTREASLVFSPEDKCADMLYTMNFAFLALHEAAEVTGDKQIKAAEDRMADFLVRIQVRSDRPSELDGAWFRGFDFKKWDYWGSNADLGWGVWATESGWTQGWIASVFALRQMKTSLWEITKDSGIKHQFAKLRLAMLPDEVLAK